MFLRVGSGNETNMETLIAVPLLATSKCTFFPYSKNCNIKRSLFIDHLDQFNTISILQVQNYNH